LHDGTLEDKERTTRVGLEKGRKKDDHKEGNNEDEEGKERRTELLEGERARKGKIGPGTRHNQNKELTLGKKREENRERRESKEEGAREKRKDASTTNVPWEAGTGGEGDQRKNVKGGNREKKVGRRGAAVKRSKKTSRRKQIIARGSRRGKRGQKRKKEVSNRDLQGGLA